MDNKVKMLIAIGAGLLVLLALAYKTFLDKAPEGGPGGGKTATEAKSGGNERVKIIGFGKEVDVKANLAAGKTTIVDFFSEFCPPCRQIGPMLVKLADKRSDIFVLKVDINREGVQGIDWQSPVARQYSLSSIPQFKIYGSDGGLVAEGEEATTQVLQMLDKEGVR